MAIEAVGLASSLASLLEISGRIVTAGYGYLSKVAHAPSRMRMVLSEVSSMNLVLGRLEEYSADESACHSTSILNTLFQNGVFEDCKEVLKKIDGTVQTCMADTEARSSKREVKSFMKRVIWPMKEKETEEVLEHLDRLRSVLSDAITQDSAASLHRLEETTQQLHQTTIKMASTQEHARLMAWVCPYDGDPSDNYQAALKHRQPGSGRWLIESDSFRNWSQQDHGIFWLRGLPGCGKTALTSTVVEHVQHSMVYKDKTVALAYFYIDYRDPAKQNLEACLAILVRQLVNQIPQGMQQLELLSEQKQRGLSRNLTASEYIDLLRVLASLQKTVYIVIDALDEAPDPRIFVDALKRLSDHEIGTPIAVLVSSRNDTNLETMLMPIVTNHVLVSSENNDDVQFFIATEVSERFTTGKLKVPDVELINLTVSKLVARADGLFLQANLLLDFVFAEAAAIDPQDSFLDPEALMDEADLIGMLSSLVLVDWKHTPPLVSLAHQTVLEYLQSQSILQSDVSQYHIDAGKTHQYLAETSIQYLLFPRSANSLKAAARSRPFQPILRNTYHDPASTASALASNLASASEPADYHTLQNASFLQQHNEMHYEFPSVLDATTPNVPKLGPCSTHVSQEQALLNYVANLWPEHLKSGRYTTEEFNGSMAPRLSWYLYPNRDGGLLYEPWEAFQRWRLSHSLYFAGPFRISDQQTPLFRQLLKSSYFNYIGHKTTQNPFFYTILFGLDDCLNLLKSQYDVNMTFCGGWTPLTVAAASGSFLIARKLLEAGADVNKAADVDERNGLTPLHIAAELAMENLVELFLAHGASVISLTATMTTPFYRAARGGSVKNLQLLHDAGSDVNAPSWDDYVPLMEAVRWSNRDAVNLLLSIGADPNFRNRRGVTSIDMASMVGDQSVVEILEEAGSKYLPKPVEPQTLRCMVEMRHRLSLLHPFERSDGDRDK